MESAQRFRSLVEQLPGLLYVANLDRYGSSVYVSPQIEELLGFTGEQWCREPELRARQLHPEDRGHVLKVLNNTIESGGSFSIDYRIHRRDGVLRWFHDEARIVTGEGGRPLFLQGAMLDITERKQAEADLERSHGKLQELIAALDSLRTDERQRLAQEMHDDFGQLLAAMKMDICTLRQHLPPDDAKLTRHLADIDHLTDAMVSSVRRIVAGLPPKALEEAGLFSALQFLSAGFEKRHGIEFSLCLSMPEPALDPQVASALYRMAQETLNNIAKHAKARRIEMRIDCTAGEIRLRVRDDGCGITPEKMTRPGAFGLTGMRQRVSALGGEMSVNGSAGMGTTVSIALPLRQNGFRT